MRGGFTTPAEGSLESHHQSTSTWVEVDFKDIPAWASKSDGEKVGKWEQMCKDGRRQDPNTSSRNAPRHHFQSVFQWGGLWNEFQIQACLGFPQQVIRCSFMEAGRCSKSPLKAHTFWAEYSLDLYDPRNFLPHHLGIDKGVVGNRLLWDWVKLCSGIWDILPAEAWPESFRMDSCGRAGPRTRAPCPGTATGQGGSPEVTE